MKQLEALSRFAGVALRVLPDFLLDHSLLEAEPEHRLPELCGRMVDLVQRLHGWGEQSVFCLRLDHLPDKGAIRLALLARPPAPQRRAALQRDLIAALRVFGIIGMADDYGRCLPLMTPAALAALPMAPGRRAWLAREIVDTFAPLLAPPPAEAAFIGITQDVTAELWADQAALGVVATDPRFGGAALAVQRRHVEAWVPLGWEGPSGPFAVPFRALIASRAAVRLSIYLQPATLVPAERLWLEKLAMVARRDVTGRDPAAELAAARCATTARRLSGGAFLVAAECVALDGGVEAAEGVAQAVRTLAVTIPDTAAGSDGVLPGARLVGARDGAADPAGVDHAELAFPRWMDRRELPQHAVRLPYLADARGAATLFRFPISVRSGVPGIEVAQAAPDYDPGPRERTVDPSPRYAPRHPAPTITIGRFENAGEAAVPVADFTKHTLITGFTGSGKTKTVLHLLHQFWVDHGIPFLVLESAKSEYRGLCGSAGFQPADGRSALAVYSAGNESVVPLRLNPFELLPGVRVEAHVNRLQTCFAAALPPFGPLASILEQSLIEIYADGGWMMTDVGPPWDASFRRFPTMSHFADKLKQVGLSRGYEGEFKATLQAAITGRILPLTRQMRSSKGLLLDNELTTPSAAVLFSAPTILEMNDLNEEDKALLSMFLLVLLREHCEQRHREAGGRSGLRHLTVIEEAHNVLAKVASTGGQEGTGADTRYRAVQAFCAMLAEVRALGEGIVIADQSPEKLAPDVMRNTNLQIAHQLRDPADREAMAQAMIMTQEQQDFIGRLVPGQAGIFYTGLQRASFVMVPQFDSPDPSARGAGFRAFVSDEEIVALMAPHMPRAPEPLRPFEGCRDCRVRVTCDYRQTARSLLGDASLRVEFTAAVGGKPTVESAMAAVVGVLAKATAQLGVSGSADAAWCCLLHMRHDLMRGWTRGGPFDREARTAFEKVAVPALRSDALTAGGRA